MRGVCFFLLLTRCIWFHVISVYQFEIKHAIEIVTSKLSARRWKYPANRFQNHAFRFGIPANMLNCMVFVVLLITATSLIDHWLDCHDLQIIKKIDTIEFGFDLIRLNLLLFSGSSVLVSQWSRLWDENNKSSYKLYRTFHRACVTFASRKTSESNRWTRQLVFEHWRLQSSKRSQFFDILTKLFFPNFWNFC